MAEDKFIGEAMADLLYNIRDYRGQVEKRIDAVHCTEEGLNWLLRELASTFYGIEKSAKSLAGAVAGGGPIADLYSVRKAIVDGPAQIQRLTDLVTTYERRVRDYNQEKRSLLDAAQRLNRMIADYRAEINNLHNLLSAYELAHARYKEEVSDLTNQLSVRDEQITRLKAEIAGLKAEGRALRSPARSHAYNAGSYRQINYLRLAEDDVFVHQGDDDTLVSVAIPDDRGQAERLRLVLDKQPSWLVAECGLEIKSKRLPPIELPI